MKRLYLSMAYPAIKILFHGDLQTILKTQSTSGVVDYPLTRRASIKDIVEAMGIPHTEVGRITVDAGDADFYYIPESSTTVEVWPFTREIALALPTVLWPVKITKVKFLVDSTALKLARDLRLLGLDTKTAVHQSILQIAESASNENRILISRNRELLQLRSVVLGQLLRSENHLEQVVEVLLRYPLPDRPQPFIRCLQCNEILHNVAKDSILHLLEPLTIKYYQEFKQCSNCRRVYWKGSHYGKLQKIVATVQSW